MSTRRRSRSHRKLRPVYALAAAGFLVAAAWIATYPRGVAAFGSGAPSDWAKLRAYRDENPTSRPRSTYLPLSAIAPELRLAVIAGEDAGYFGHGAIDPHAIREAISEWAAGARLRGASTLTQQLAKNLFLSDERTLWRKLREARYALALEEQLGKERILELYLNVIELDRGVFGVEAASRHYFGVSAAALGADRAAQLAAAIPSPLRHNPVTRTKAWHKRYRAIRERMRRFDWLRERVVGEARAERPQVRTPPPPAVAPLEPIEPDGGEDAPRGAPQSGEAVDSGEAAPGERPASGEAEGSGKVAPGERPASGTGEVSPGGVDAESRRDGAVSGERAVDEAPAG